MYVPLPVLCVCGLSLAAGQKVQSRQEELKERARLLLEQARRDAAMKTGNKSPVGISLPTTTRAFTAAEVSLCGVCDAQQ